MLIHKKDIRNRKGIIRIPWPDVYEEADIVQMIFSKVIPVRGELMFEYNAIEYQCYSTEFDEVGTDSMPPHYEIEVAKDYNIWGREIITIKFIRQK